MLGIAKILTFWDLVFDDDVKLFGKGAGGWVLVVILPMGALCPRGRNEIGQPRTCARSSLPFCSQITTGDQFRKRNRPS